MTAVLGALASLTAISAQAPLQSITGSITYRERIALPPAAVVEVTIADVSRADAPAVVIGRQRIESPGQVPIPFRVDYEPSAIDPRHRYSVRATIANGSELMFTSTEAALVITQGHGMTADLLLRRVTEPPAPPKPPAPASPAASQAHAVIPSTPALPPAPPLPANPLVSLPATFSGTWPCADCPGIRVQLNLFRDDSFFMRRTEVGKAVEPSDDLGSWVLSSDRRVLMLKGSGDAPMFFAVASAGTLRPLDSNGNPIAGTAPTELRRALTHQPLDVRAKMRGSYVYTADAATFTECSTGQRWPVAMEAASIDLERAYLAAKREPMAPMLVIVDARVASRPKFEGPGPAPALVSNYRPALVVVKVEHALPATDVCAPRLVSAPLTGTLWRLSRLGERAVPPAADVRGQASLEFQADPMRFSGSSGCNRLIGGYTAENAAMTLTAAGTMMACPGAMADEAAFLAALKATRGYRIVGSWLELLDAKGASLARFEAK
ncbi:MAG TPA: YbaY family lipoprotein [Vicinamibacterales bacterium]|nr:YbaY family lipoprotein [Vicinamibacterales bacterium]